MAKETVFDWANQPKLQESIEDAVDVGEGTAYVTGSKWYNAKTKAGKVTLVLNLSLVTFDETNVDQIMARVQTSARQHYEWLRDCRVAHYNFLQGVDPDNQLTIEDELAAGRQSKGPGRPKKEATSDPVEQGAKTRKLPAKGRKKKADPAPATDVVTVAAE